MNPQEIEKLLGGYATGTLTEAEQRTLFDAALTNQDLFDALADEQALRELLEDPAGRARLLAVLREPEPSWMARIAAWLRRPSALALASAVAAGIVVVAVIGPPRARKPAPVETAQLREAPAPNPAPPAGPKPAAQAESRPARPPVPEPRAKAIERQEPERDAAAPAPLQAAAPPPPAAAAVRSEAAAAAPAAPAAESGQALKKEAAVNARDLYYAPLPAPPAVSGFMDEQKPAPAGKRRQSARPFGNSMERLAAPAAAPARLPGVHYSILKRNPDGSFAEVDPAAAFARGDVLRIRLEANQPGTLAVMQRQANGAWAPLLTAPVREAEPVYVPASGVLEIRDPGEMHFFVRFARTPQPAPRPDQPAPASGLARDKVANSVYLVNRTVSADAAVEFEITIAAK